MSTYAFRLLVLHRRFDDAIRSELKARWPDVVRVQRLKKLKLAAKDRLLSLATRGRILRPA